MLDGVNEIIVTTLDGEVLASIANYDPSVIPVYNTHLTLPTTPYV